MEYRIAAWHRDQERCKLHGGPYLECEDADRDWFPQRVVCWPDAQLQAAKRLFDLMHEDAPYHDGSFKVWSKKPTPATPFHYADGTRFFMAPIDLAPWDEWTTDPLATPDKPEGWVESVAEESPEQQDGPEH